MLRCVFMILFCFSILFLVFLIPFISADECKPNKIQANTECTITKTLNKTYKQDSVLFRIADVQLFANDSLKVKIGDDTYQIEFFSDGFIILPKQNEYVFYLKTTDGPDRKFKSIEMLAKAEISIHDLNAFTVLIKSGVAFKDSLLLLNSEIHSSVLLSSENQGVTATATSPNDPETQSSLLDDQDFLTDKKKISLTFNLKNSKVDNFFNFNLIQTSKSCSANVKVDDKPALLKTIDKNATLSKTTYTCVYLVSASTDNLKVDQFDFKTTNAFDSIVIKDGLKLSSVNLINSNTKDASKYLNDLEHTVSSSGRFMVILSSSFVSKNYEQGTVTIEKLKFTKLTQEGDFTISVAKETIAIFSVGDKYPALRFEKDALKLNVDLTVYDSLDLSSEPVFSLKSGEFVNNQLWSEKKVLVLKLASSDKSTELKGRLESQTINCNRMRERPYTFILNANSAFENQTCSVYFKPNEVAHSVIFDLESVKLDDKSCISLKNVSSQQDIFKLCQLPDVQEALVKEHLPELILSSNESYVLTYDRNKSFKDGILVQASFTYNARPLVRNFTLNKDQSNQVIQSYNFPSNYPYIVKANDMDLVSSDKFLFVSFETQNLRNGDELKIFNPVASVNHTLGFIDDFTINQINAPLPFSLLTRFEGAEAKSLLSGSFGSGFKANVERIDCILELDSNNTLRTPGYPNNFVNATRCISVINLSDSKVAKYLDITITNGKGDANYGSLTIYDDHTIHRNISALVLNFNQTVLKNNETIRFNTSSSKIILEFKSSSDKITSVNGFQMQLNPVKCPFDSCDDKTRCLLESIHCDYIVECIDLKDEMNCSIDHGKQPPPPPQIITEYRGLPGWVIIFIIIPLSALVGWAIAMHGRKLVTRFRGHTYQEFNTFSENA